jgi:hypothetical protein
MNNLLQVLACPHCRAILRPTPDAVFCGPVFKSGGLYCSSCRRIVGGLRFGKADFLRFPIPPETMESGPISPRNSPWPHFVYRRIPWSAPEISFKGLIRKHLGWTPEGFGESLFTEREPRWELAIETSAMDVDVRLVSGPSSGPVDVFLDGVFYKTFSLRDPSLNEIVACPVFRDRKDTTSVRITMRPGKPPAGVERADKPCPSFCFSGYDAAFGRSESQRRETINRGNRYPDTYRWAMDLLAPNGLAIDCGSGDRTYGDRRLLSFEYLPFELPDVFGDGRVLPFRDAAFDVVFSQAVMEHMSDPFQAARELVRILKPGGLLYAESAFMQPLHAVPYHFFNTTPWGIEELFVRNGLESAGVEWFGGLAGSLKWYMDVCGGSKKVSPEEMSQLTTILGKADAALSYADLKSVASGVAFWGIKPGSGPWKEAVASASRPTYVY